MSNQDRLVLEVPKSTGCVDVPGVSVFYGVQSLKELLGVLEIDSLILGFRPPSERNLKARSTPQV